MQKWTNELNIGVSSLDNQHKNIFKLVDKVCTMLEHEKSMADVKYEVENVENAIAIHFLAEERYMKQYNFPGLEQHSQEHEIFKKNIGILKSLYLKNGGSFTLISIIESQISEWHKNHIMKFDKILGDYLSRNKLLK